MERKRFARLSQRLGALLLAGVTLWTVYATAGSVDAAGAWMAVKRELPLALLQWQLGDMGQRDGLSAPSVLMLSQAPILLSARGEISDLRRQAAEEPEDERPAPVTQPVREESQPAPVTAGADNGVTAKTLIPTDPSGYTVCGKVYIRNTTQYTLSNEELLEGAGLAEKPARWSGNIHTEAEQMRTLVEQMLTLARADNGVRPAAMEPLNLSDVATDCVLAFEPVAFEAGKPLEERITADITVVGDADRLRRLISILLDNAVKYGAEGGHITLTLEKTDRQARLTVSNPGDPIPPEHLAHLFERFYRADASRGEKSGFGLGLAIADTIAREHKGVLKAESDTASTRFTFTMPLKK